MKFGVAVANGVVCEHSDRPQAEEVGERAGERRADPGAEGPGLVGAPQPDAEPDGARRQRQSDQHGDPDEDEEGRSHAPLLPPRPPNARTGSGPVLARVSRPHLVAILSLPLRARAGLPALAAL